MLRLFLCNPHSLGRLPYNSCTLFALICFYKYANTNHFKKVSNYSQLLTLLHKLWTLFNSIIMSSKLQFEDSSKIEGRVGYDFLSYSKYMFTYIIMNRIFIYFIDEPTKIL